MIRKMCDADLSAVLAIEQEQFVNGWKTSMFQYELHDNPYAYLCVLEKDGHICGYMDYWITFEKAQLANIAVKESEKRKGYAKEMMEYMIAASEKALCENITLEVRINNDPALALYQSYGFMKVAVRKGYYEGNTDGYLMVKPLGGNYV